MNSRFNHGAAPLNVGFAPFLLRSNEKYSKGRKSTLQNTPEHHTQETKTVIVAVTNTNKGKTMIKKIFAVRDSKAEYFNPPMFFHTIGEAERAFKHTASKQDNSIGQFPQDFDLWLLGEYDDQTGKIQQQEPMHLINGALISNQNA